VPHFCHNTKSDVSPVTGFYAYIKAATWQNRRSVIFMMMVTIT